MMHRRATEAGYILASVLVAMIVIGALAGGLVMMSVAELRAVRQAEIEAERRAGYESVIALTAAELTREPDSRSLQFEDSTLAVLLGGQTYDVRVEWESEKLDLNTASLEDIEAEASMLPIPTSSLMLQLDTARQGNGAIHLIGDLFFEDSRVKECLRSRFTVFGGRRRLGQAGTQNNGVLERPTPGTRVRLLISERDQQRTADVVLLMTGDRFDPSRMLDWRWVERSQINDCGPIEHHGGAS